MKRIGDLHYGKEIIDVYYLLESNGKKGKRKRYYYTLLCDCGSEFKCVTHKDPGKRKCRTCSKTKHGESRGRLYKTHQNMIARCNKGYTKNNVEVCDERKDFNSFKDRAINNGYASSLTIDRKDNKGNYEPSNCRRATMKQQGVNRGNTQMYKGVPTIDLCKKIGINYQTFRARLSRGMNIYDALYKKVGKYTKNHRMA